MRLIVAVAACCFALQSENIFGGMFTQGVALGCYVPTLQAEEENANPLKYHCPVVWSLPPASSVPLGTKCW